MSMCVVGYYSNFGPSSYPTNLFLPRSYLSLKTSKNYTPESILINITQIKDNTASLTSHAPLHLLKCRASTPIYSTLHTEKVTNRQTDLYPLLYIQII